jgi:putative nucleotidyltransferase with HDIG domain
MRKSAQQQHAAEAIGLKIRWVLLVGVALLGISHFGEAWFAAGFGLLAVSNLIGWHLCSKADVYQKVGGRFMTLMRLVDVAALTYLSFDGPFQGDNLWLLTIPAILSEGLISRDVKPVIRLTAVAIALPIYHVFQPPVSNASLSAITSMLLAAFVGVILRAYRDREQVLQARDERLSTVLNCAAALAASTDLRSMISHTLRACTKELDAKCGYVMLTNEDNKDVLSAEAAYSVEGEFEFPKKLDVGAGVTGYAVKMGQPISIHNTDDEQLDVEGVNSGARSIVSVPLVARNYMGPAQASNEQVLGAITLLGNSEDSFANPDDMHLLRSLAALVAEAVSNANMEERQRTTFLMTLETLAKSLEARDVYTRGHSQRVCEVSMMIGERMGLNSEALEELRVGTILHDIGKIGVPDSILNKPGRLTDEEFLIMKSHPVIGYEICSPLGLSEGVLMIIRNHHEKLDGTGYPDGLKGGELPLSLRIVCVADAFDAMSSRRPYRDVMAMSRVIAELSAGAGVQFDPVVVEMLKDLLSTEQMRICYETQWSGDDGEEVAA